MGEPIGPNVRRLMAIHMSIDAVPSNGGMLDAIKFLSSKESLLTGARNAQEWVKSAINAVRQAGEPNPWKNSDDESIAGEILRKVDARKASRIR
jgi:hypothetical protein